MRFATLGASLAYGLALVSASPIDSSANIKRQAPSVCNGRPEYCGRKYSNVSQIVSHDSAFVGELPQDNQVWSVQDQLNNGVRFLTAQSHKGPSGELQLCHTYCLLEDAGNVQDYLGTIKTWLDRNPNEVVTVLLTNGDNVGMDVFDAAFVGAQAKNYAYVPPSNPLAIDQWPTLGEMITSGKRLVVFMDYGADTTKYPYILDEFAYFFETPFDTTDPNFPQCKVDRPPNANPAGRMYLVNHNLDYELGNTGILVPYRLKIDDTNAATGNPGSIMTQANLCAGLYQTWPKGVLLDYVDAGNWKDAELIMNGLKPQ